MWQRRYLSPANLSPFWDTYLKFRQTQTSLSCSFQVVCSPVEVQALISTDEGSPGQHNSSAATSWSDTSQRVVDPITGLDAAASVPAQQAAGYVVSAASSKVQAALTSDQMAAVAAVAAGVAAEVGRGFRARLPARSFSPEQNLSLDKPTALAAVSLEAPAIGAVYASRGAGRLSIATGSFLASPVASAAGLVVGAEALRLGLAVGERGRPDEAAVSVAVASPVLWGTPGLGVSFATVEVSVGRQVWGQPPSPAAVSQAASQPSGSLVSSLGSLLSPGRSRTAATAVTPAAAASTVAAIRVDGQPCMRLADLQAAVKQPAAEEDTASNGQRSPNQAGAEAEPEHALPTQIFLAAGAASAEVSWQQWEALVTFGTAFAAGPPLPQLPGLPPASLPTASKPLHLHLSLEAFEGRIAGGGSSPEKHLTFAVGGVTVASEQGTHRVSQLHARQKKPGNLSFLTVTLLTICLASRKKERR